MKGRLLLALCGISLLYLPLPPCRAVPYGDLELHDNHQQRAQHPVAPYQGLRSLACCMWRGIYCLLVEEGRSAGRQKEETGEPPDKRFTNGIEKMDLLVRILKAKSAFWSGLSKNEVKSDPPSARRHSADSAKPHVLLLARSHSSSSLSQPIHSRVKRHAHHRSRFPQYMRVGCSLGTCKTQHLSHQLWQFMSKKGHDVSAPFTLNSPDSYG